MRRRLLASFLLLAACGDLNLVGDLDLFDGLFEPGPGFFSRMDTATDWVTGVEECGIKLDGGLWCWAIDEKKIVTVHQVSVNSSFQQVVASTAGVCALDKAGVALCWLQQGVDGVPYTTKGPWKTLSMGHDRVCGIHDGGTLWCWGTLSYNTAQTEPATGEPSFVDYTSSPRQLTDGTWISVASGTDDTSGWNFNLENPVGPFCAVRSDETLWCYHLAADQSFDPLFSPDVLSSFGSVPSWESVYVGANLICGLTNDQHLSCYQDGWGRDVPGNWLSFSMHGTTQCGVKDDHSLWCWGILPGNGDLYSSHHTKERKRNWASVQVGPDFVCGVTLDHSLYCLALPGGFMESKFEASSPIMVDGKTLSPSP